jgi:hypothetical protein
MHGVEDSSIALASTKARGPIVRGWNERTDKGVSVNNSIKESLGALVDSIAMLVDKSREELKADNRSLMLMMALTTFVGLGIAVCVATFLDPSICWRNPGCARASESDCRGGLDGRGASGPEPG